MSLNFDYKNVKDSDTLMFGDDDLMKPVSQVVIWRMMHTGIGWELTGGNAKEFYIRCNLLDRLWGPLLLPERSLTADEIKAHIGLHVNVSPETRPKFLKRVMETTWYDLAKEFE